jgi:hypothetical protein
MDPQQTWYCLLQCVAANDMQEAREHAINLLSWMRRGGFPPMIHPTLERVDLQANVFLIQINRLVVVAFCGRVQIEADRFTNKNAHT